MQDYNYDERLEQFPIAMAYVPWQHMRIWTRLLNAVLSFLN